MLAAIFHGMSFVELAKIAIIVLAVIGCVYVFIKASGINFPPWVWQLVIILVAAVLCILAIEFLASL